MHALDGLGDYIEVLGRVEGDVDAAEEPDGLRPLAGAVHDHLGLDDAPVGHDASDPIVPRGDAGHPGALGDADAPQAGPPGEGSRHVDRVDGGVAGQPEGAEQIGRLQDRVAPEGLGGSEQLAFEVVGRGRGRRPAELDHPLGRARHRHAAAPLEAGGEARLRLELAIEAGGVLHQAGAGLGRPELAEEARRVPRRPARELPLLEQEDVGPPEAGQVVRGGGPDHPAADDHGAGAVGQVTPGGSVLHGGPLLAGRASVCPRHISQEPLEVGTAEGGLGPLVLLHPPRPEIESDRAGGVLDGRPQRPPALGHEAPQARPGQATAGGGAVVGTDQLLRAGRG